MGRPSQAAVLVLALALASCDGGAGKVKAAPLVILGVDGLDWSTLLPLLEAGELPTFRSWLEHGQGGLLESMRPTKSPVVWTTVATGKSPEEHGILDFTRPGGDGGRELFTRSDRRVAALWNMASDRGLRVAVVGWWMTHPVEVVSGVMVAQTNSLPGEVGPGGGLWKGAPVEGTPEQVYPPAWESRVWEILAATDRELEPRLGGILPAMRPPLPRTVGRLWEATRWSLRADLTYLEVLGELLRQEEFDLVMVYVGGPDVIGHRFWRYMEPEQFSHPPSRDDIERFGTVLPDYLRFLDGALGSLPLSPDTSNILLLSDHGMTPHHQESSFDEDARLGDLTSGHHFRAPPGVLIAAGPDIRSRPWPDGPISDSALPVVGSVYDVTPTALGLLGLPSGRDQRGVPMTALLKRSKAVGERGSIASYDDYWQPSGSPSGTEATPDLEKVDQERLEQLRDLGYIGDD